MKKTKLPTFKGKPLIEIPEFIPQAGFLEGDFGKAFLEEYNGRVSADYNDNSNLNVLSYRNNVVKGSNPFAVVLANQILREENLRTATQADLEKALRIGWDLKETYEDTGLVLISEEDQDYSRNTSLAKDIAKPIKVVGIKFSPKKPVMIPLTGLELENSDNYYGLTFKLRGDTKIYEAPILAKGGQFNSEDIDEKIGLPKKLSSSGDRTLYTRGSGLSRLNLYLALGLYSRSKGLDNSFDTGRVVAVSGEGTSQEKLKSDLIKSINEEYQAQVEELNSRKAEAEKSVREIMSRKK